MKGTTAMRHRNTDPDVIEDGGSVRVPLMMMDSVQRNVVDVRDHQPRHGIADENQQSLKDAAYDERDEYLRSAWRNPPSVHAKDSPSAAANEVEEERKKVTAETAEDARKAYEKRTQDAWKTKGTC
jgi:hypothetical protein